MKRHCYLPCACWRRHSSWQVNSSPCSPLSDGTGRASAGAACCPWSRRCACGSPGECCAGPPRPRWSPSWSRSACRGTWRSGRCSCCWFRPGPPCRRASASADRTLRLCWSVRGCSWKPGDSTLWLCND